MLFVVGRKIEVVSSFKAKKAKELFDLNGLVVKASSFRLLLLPFLDIASFYFQHTVKSNLPPLSCQLDHEYSIKNPISEKTKETKRNSKGIFFLLCLQHFDKTHLDSNRYVSTKQILMLNQL